MATGYESVWTDSRTAHVHSRSPSAPARQRHYARTCRRLKAAAEDRHGDVEDAETEIGRDEHADLVERGAAGFPVVRRDGALQACKGREENMHEEGAHDDADRGHRDHVRR